MSNDVRSIIENLYTGHEHRDLYLGVIDSIESFTRNRGTEVWIQAAQNNFDALNEIDMAAYEAGLMGLGLPEEYGGLGGGIMGPVLVTDLMAQKGVSSFTNMNTHFSRYPVVAHGTPAQIEKFVIPTLTEKKLFCICATEANAGTNTFNISTKALKKGDKWILNGQKTWISSADKADYGFLIAKTGLADPRALSIFIVDMQSPGISRSKLNTDVFPGEDQFQVFFDDVEMPLDALIGEEGGGARCMFEGLNPERLIVSALVLGLSDLALGMALEHVKNRAPFGQPIGSYQAIQHRLAEDKSRADAARLMMYYATKLYDEGGNVGTQANMTKFLASTASTQMLDDAIQFHGGTGMDEDSGLLAAWRICRTARFAPVNNEIVLSYIATHELGLPKSYYAIVPGYLEDEDYLVKKSKFINK